VEALEDMACMNLAPVIAAFDETGAGLANGSTSEAEQPKGSASAMIKSMGEARGAVAAPPLRPETPAPNAAQLTGPLPGWGRRSVCRAEGGTKEPSWRTRVAGV